MSASSGQAADCISAIEEVMAVIGGKWSFLVISHLKIEPLRFNELKRRIAGISTQSLTVFLRQLEQQGIVRREVYPTVPVSVEYSLTAKGMDCAAVIEQIRQCGLAWRARAAE